MVDTDHNGSIDYSEFVTACINKENILSRKRLKAAFRIFDKDNSGGIDMDELKEVFRNSGDISDEVFKEMIRECLASSGIDTFSKDSTIDFE